jgi:GNAT superfamily N-acetyltransferase
VRPARRDDVPRLVELLVGGALRAGKEDASAVNAYLAALDEIEATPRSLVLVAEADGVVVGTVQVFAVRHLQEQGGLAAELESMHVAADQRGGGVGSQLVRAAVEVARGWGAYRVQLTSNTVRTDAHRFYERLGFSSSHVGFKLPLR